MPETKGRKQAHELLLHLLVVLAANSGSVAPALRFIISQHEPYEA
jgi:hypothetical protein